MSGSGPTDGDNPFEGLPFFGDLSKLLGGLLGQGGGGMQWNTTRQVAMQLASGGAAEANVDPVVRIDLEELARIAEMHVASVTGLTPSATGRGVTVLPVTRSQWAERSFDAYRPLFEALAGALTLGDGDVAPGSEAGPSDPTDPLAPADDPLSAMLGQLMESMAPMLLSVTAGGMLGHLAQRSFGQYDLPLPRTASDELMLVMPNVDSFAQDWSIDTRDLRLWLCLHEISHHAVLNVPHVREALESMIRDYASSFRPDPNALVDRLGDVDMTDPGALANMQNVLGDPSVMLGAIQTDEQRSMLPRLEATIAVVVGYVDRVMDTIGAGLISGYSMITEALHRRRVEADESDRFVARLFGLEITQQTYDTGTGFIDGVVERAGFDALEPLWREARFLPTPAEIEAPGLWLARIELPEE